MICLPVFQSASKVLMTYGLYWMKIFKLHATLSQSFSGETRIRSLDLFW